MKFATGKQIVAMVIIIVIGCYAFDYYKNPQLWHHETVTTANSEKGARLTLWINHLCCSQCLNDIRLALAGLPGIDAANANGPTQLLTREQADQSTASLPSYGNSVELVVNDPDQLDFMELDKKLRDKGMVAGRIELSGIEHFALAAKVDHLCCGMCDKAAHERMAFLKARGQSGQLKWLDSMSVNRETKTIVAYARFLEAGKTVDVTEFLGALNDIGYAPRSMQILGHEHTTFTSSRKQAEDSLRAQTPPITEN
jgi:copper chaperone CopZ